MGATGWRVHPRVNRLRPRGARGGQQQNDLVRSAEHGQFHSPFQGAARSVDLDAVIVPFAQQEYGRPAPGYGSGREAQPIQAALAVQLIGRKGVELRVHGAGSDSGRIDGPACVAAEDPRVEDLQVDRGGGSGARRHRGGGGLAGRLRGAHGQCGLCRLQSLCGLASRDQGDQAEKAGGWQASSANFRPPLAGTT